MIFSVASAVLMVFITLCCMAADPMAPINPAAFKDPVRIACIGDSITEGVGAGVVAATSWPAQLQGLLGAAWQVGNFGVSGRTLLKKGDFPYWNDKAYQNALAFKPDVVLIMLGTNDSKPQNWKHEAEFESDYRELVKSFQALASKPRIYLCRPCPVPGAGNYGINEAGVKQEIARIDALAAEMNLGVIDMYAALADKPQLLPDNVHPNIDGHREMAKAAFLVLTGKSAEPRNLVPSEPGTSPNYWCTWSVQSYMQGQGAKANDPILYQVASIDKYAALQLNEETLFGTNGWVKNFYPKVRGDLWVVLDDGWDLPVNRDLGYRNYSKLDPEKFPSFKGSIPENLVTLNQRVKACGWRGVGLWYRAYEPAVDAERKKTFKSEAEYKKVFWRERLEWSKAAGIGYWKMDGGGDEAAWRLVTDFADQFYPGLVMEHGNPSKDGPFNSYPGNGRVYPAYVEAGKRVIQYSEVMRLHDHSPQLGIPTMLGRMASILDAVKTKPAKTGYLNCEDEVFIAAVLGGAMGVMRSPMVGLRPGDDPDIFLKGPRNLKKRMDEVVRAVRWHRLAPAFGAGVMETHVDSKMLVDSYKFPAGEFWTSTEDWATKYASPYACMNKVVAQEAPARVTRGLPLPEVVCAGEPPYVLASRNPNGAVSIGTLGRLSPERGCYFPEADVSLSIGRITGNIGIFGYFKSLTLVLDKPLGEFRIWAQDLAGDSAVDITSKVFVEGNRLVFPGDLLKTIGLASVTPGDLSDPALVVEISR